MCFLSKHKNITPGWVVIDGNTIRGTDRVTVCTSCTKTQCSCRSPRMCTSAYHWNSVTLKYKWKMFGRIRLRCYLNATLREETLYN